MYYNKSIYIICFLLICSIQLVQVQAQVQIKGTVYDSIGRTPVQFVSVLTASGKGTVTDAKGSYTIQTFREDSIWFSYLNKPTRKFAVKDIKTPYAFDLSLRVNIPLLPEATVRNRNYRQDSIENREAYAKVFDFQKPGLSTTMNTDGFGAAFDLDEIINAFRFKRTRSMLSFQRKLLTEEKDNFVKHRFSKALVRRITGLTEDSVLTDFINQYQPSYLFASRVNDYIFHKYIKDSYERYKRGFLPDPMWLEGVTGNEEEYHY